MAVDSALKHDFHPIEHRGEAESGEHTLPAGEGDAPRQRGIAQNAVALAAGIDRVLGDAALARRIALAGRERALNRFSLAAMLDRMEVVFQRALDGDARE